MCIVVPIYLHVHAPTYLCTCTYLSMYMYIYTCTYLPTYPPTHLPTYMYLPQFPSGQAVGRYNDNFVCIVVPICMYLHAPIATYNIPSCTYLPTHVPTYPRTYLPTYLPTYPHTHLPTYPRTHLPTYLPTYLPPSLNSPQDKLCEDIMLKYSNVAENSTKNVNHSFSVSFTHL